MRATPTILNTIVLLGALSCASPDPSPAPAPEPVPAATISGYYEGRVQGAGDPAVRGTLYHDGAHLRGTLLVQGVEGYTAVLHLDGDVAEDGTLTVRVRDPGCADAAVCGLVRGPAEYEASGNADDDGIHLDRWWFAGSPESAIDDIEAVNLVITPRDGFKPVEGQLSTDGVARFVGRVTAFVQFDGRDEVTDGFCNLDVDLTDADRFWLDDGTIVALSCEGAALGDVHIYDEFRPDVRHDDTTGRFATAATIEGIDLLFVGKYGAASNDADLMGVIIRDQGSYPTDQPIPDPASIPDYMLVGSFFFTRPDR